MSIASTEIAKKEVEKKAEAKAAEEKKKFERAMRDYNHHKEIYISNPSDANRIDLEYAKRNLERATK